MAILGALLRRPSLLAAGLLLAAAGVPQVQGAPSIEYDLKAAFLYNFVKFVEWPPDAFAGERAPIAICVFGEDPFGRSLDAVVRGEEVGGRSFVVQRPDGLRELGGCHVAFVSRSERGRFPEVLSALEGKPVLTVSDTDGFLRSGGVINFVLEENKVRFLINSEAAERKGLRISSKLMRLAMTAP